MHEKFYPYFIEPGRAVQPEYYNKGPVSFLAHLGKPLSDALWDDLVNRLHIRRLSVFTVSEPGKCCEEPDSAAIYLNNYLGEFCVADIAYQNWYS